MMKSLNHYQWIADEMVRQDEEKNQMQAAMEDMWQGRWKLPEEIADLRWMHKVVSTDPHDALRAGVRVLSTVAPRIKVHPTTTGPDCKAQADLVERALSWLFHQANRRRQASVLSDIVLSSLLYDEVVAQVVYLPHQIRAVAAAGGDTTRLKAAHRGGAFALLIRNPRQVHVRCSDWMAEAVVLRRVMPAADLISFWGRQANRVSAALAEDRKGELRYATVYDYMDLEHRVVWAYLHEDPSAVLPAAGLDTRSPKSDHLPYQIVRQAHGLGFLPWVAKVGGTTLAQTPAHQRIPLLYSVYQSGQWETQNILETLLTSEVIAYAAAPRLKVEGPTNNVEVDYGEPGRAAYVPPGHELTTLRPPGMDESLAAIADRVGQRIDKSTIPRVLQTADFPPGAAFATLNLATQSGLKSLNPYKALAEQALAEIFSQMLDWIALDGRPVAAYSRGRGRAGEQIVLDPHSFDPQELTLEVELTADIPTDKVARIGAAAQAVRELGYSRARALEYVGESDPTVILEERRQEEREALAHQIELKKEGAAHGLDQEALPG
jgi:hypothetical protein